MIYKTRYFSLDTDTLSVKDTDGDAVETQNKEFGLLRFLCEQNRACSEEEILENVWDRNVDYTSNVVHVTLSKIRKKLGKDAVVTKHNKFLAELVSPKQATETRKWSRKVLVLSGLFLFSALTFLLFQHDNAVIVIADMKAKGENTPLHESVTLKNTSNKAVSLWGWKLQDTALHTYIFENREIEAGKTLVVITGKCENTNDQVCWNFEKEVWNDTKDTIVLKDGNGKLVTEYAYDFTNN